MLIGTHNSLSSYPCLKWYMKPFNFISKCQTKTLEEQFNSGCRSFDFRFIKYKDKWYAAHGMMIYNITLEQSIKILKKLARKDKIRFRVVHEDVLTKSSEKDLNELIDKTKALLGIANAVDTNNPELLYITSKSTWKNYYESQYLNKYQNYDSIPTTENDRDSLCEKIAFLYELKTTDDKINFIGAYESGGIPIRIFGWQPIIKGFPLQIPIPKVAANAITKIALKKSWKDNDLVVVDFL